MKRFSFVIKSLECGGMELCVMVGGHSADISASYMRTDIIEKFIYAVRGFHPGYEDTDVRMAWSREDSILPCERIEIDEEGSSAVWEISVKDSGLPADGRILHVRIDLDRNITRQTLEADVPYREFAGEIMRALDGLLTKKGLTEFYREWGEPFPLTDFLLTKTLLTGSEPHSFAEELNILGSVSEYR